jgi:hypothetical protein
MYEKSYILTRKKFGFFKGRSELIKNQQNVNSNYIHEKPQKNGKEQRED